MLAESGMRFDEVHTSLLRRSIRTTNLALMELGQEYIPVYKHWRLNERSYGALGKLRDCDVSFLLRSIPSTQRLRVSAVGKNKKEAVKMYGQDQVKSWRRAYDDPPPPMEDDHEFHPAKDPRYKDVRTTEKVSIVWHCSFFLATHTVNQPYFIWTHRCFTSSPSLNH